MNDDNMLHINVNDAVGTAEAIGQPDPAPELTTKIVPPHKMVSREVVEADLPRVFEEADALYRLCFTPQGIYSSAHAMAHPQIDDKDPLRFFVTVIGEVIINPKIVKHSDFAVDSKEACMSFPDREQIIVPRWNVIDVEFQTLTKDRKLSDVMRKTVSGKVSKIFQHELGHMQGHYIYDEGSDVTDCLDKTEASA